MHVADLALIIFCVIEGRGGGCVKEQIHFANVMCECERVFLIYEIERFKLLGVYQ